MLAAGFTLHREIGYALDDCLTATLPPCTMPGKLEETEISEIPENSCIGHTIERNAIPTTTAPRHPAVSTT
ncbi:MAG: hypothetical protein L3J30_11050 [Marinosulfonomonas sp.]|nr:hypothetical protein [Marinosulfonomonas sp.]